MKSRAAILFACNDPDNGDFAGRVTMAHYESADAELECDAWEKGYRFSVADGVIRLHRRKFQFVSRTFWVGNWCWDRFVFERSEAKRLLLTMQNSDRWHCVGARVRFCDWFNRESVE